MIVQTKCLIKRGFSESGGLVPTKPGNLSVDSGKWKVYSKI